MDAFLKDKPVVPRKRHRCAWCCEWCEVGEPARYRAYRFDGEFQTDYMHPECYDAMGKSNLDGEGFGFGEMQRGKTMEESER